MPRPKSIQTLRRLANGCHDCPLWKSATQTVFGEGPDDARIMLIGEQAGDREDKEGHPFVGPAGTLLERALREIGIRREDVYITNVVKHFKFEQRGKRRLHKHASAAEVQACLQWLEAELLRIRPRYVVCLGALASHVVLGASFKLTKQRGHWINTGDQQWAIATVHPASVLRARAGENADVALGAFLADLGRLRKLPESS